MTLKSEITKRADEWIPSTRARGRKVPPITGPLSKEHTAWKQGPDSRDHFAVGGREIHLLLRHSAVADERSEQIGLDLELTALDRERLWRDDVMTRLTMSAAQRPRNCLDAEETWRPSATASVRRLDSPRLARSALHNGAVSERHAEGLY